MDFKKGNDLYEASTSSHSSQGPDRNSAGLLNNLLGGQCSPINVIAIVPLQNACTNQVACCSGSSNGLLNIACTNLNV
ncbi:hypothetical protein H633G_00223 [Metarhizium anisopliae BRIP 53284]|nr:hypothetical protein H633G_00223 [Metarhizium anisopliae BRIP 53284]